MGLEWVWGLLQPVFVRWAPPLLHKTTLTTGFDSPKNVTFFHSKLLSENSASFTSSTMKNLCQKWKVKTNYSRRLYRLSGTGIVECLEVTDVGCNLEQFDGLTCYRPWPPPPYTSLHRTVKIVGKRLDCEPLRGRSAAVDRQSLDSNQILGPTLQICQQNAPAITAQPYK